MGELTRISEQADKKTKRRESLANSRPSTANAASSMLDGVNGSDIPLQNGGSGDVANGVAFNGISRV